MQTLVQNRVVDKNLVQAVALLSASKVLSDRAAKLQREFLRDGAEHEVELTILAKVDGIDYRHDFEGGKLTVGHPTHRAGTVNAGELVAWILAHIESDVRKAILEEALAVYEANDCSFPVSKRDFEEVEDTLSEMRIKNATQARGAVSVKFKNGLL